jgi:hypothetical protein
MAAKDENPFTVRIATRSIACHSRSQSRNCRSRDNPPSLRRPVAWSRRPVRGQVFHAAEGRTSLAVAEVPCRRGKCFSQAAPVRSCQSARSTLPMRARARAIKKASRLIHAPSDQGGRVAALCACAGEETADLRLPVCAHVRPHDRRPELIRLGDHCIVRHDDPLAMQAHAIVAVLRIPIDVVYSEAVSERAAQSPCRSRAGRTRISAANWRNGHRHGPARRSSCRRGTAQLLASRAHRQRPMSQPAVSLREGSYA